VTWTFRRADDRDANQAMGLVGDRLRWLGGRGLGQWSTRDQAAVVRASIHERNTWLLCQGPHALATLAMSTTADPTLWTPTERQQPALYVTKLATSLHHTGQGLGDLLLDCAVAYGRGRGIPTLRWDAWTTNTDLHRYYTTRAGVRHLRTTGGHLSGALFELAHTARRPPDHVQITAPMTVQATLPTLAQQLPPGVGEPTGDQPPGITWFQVPDLPIPQAPGGYLNLPATHGPQPVIWHDEDHWQIHQTSTYPIHPPTNLTPGRPYTIHLTNDHTTAQILGDHI
jgi:GNAT superfamily N-acetyltransferase